MLNTIERHFNQTLTNKRYSSSDNDTEELQEVGSFLGYIQPVDNTQVNYQDQTITQTHALWCAVDTNIQIQDIVDDENGLSYIVNGIKKWDIGTSPHLEVQLEENTGK